MKTRKIKKLWNNIVSLRDYEVKDAIAKGGIKILFGKYTMTLTKEQLETGVQLTSKKFLSKTGGKDYVLLDYRWNPDKELVCG